jgi:hypothetical protein
MGVKFGGKGGGSAGSTLPSEYEYKTSLTTGKLQLWKKAVGAVPARLVSEQDPDGTWLSTSMSTGVGSVHLGGGASSPVHSMSSIGQNVGFKNEAFNSTPGSAIVWFPTWQGLSADLTGDYKPTYLSFGEVQDALSMNGIARAVVVPFDFVTTVASNLCVQSMTAWATETYQGKLKTIIRSYPKGVDLHASTQTVNIYSGSQFTVEVPSLYFARAGDRLQFIMQKEDGAPLQVRGGTTNTAQPWRTFRCRSFVDVAMAPETAIKTTSFLAKDGGTYIIEQPTKAESGGTVETLYQYTGAISTGASINAGQALSIFKNNPDKTSNSPDGWGSNWNNHNENSATPCRVTLDFGETVQLVAMEWQGQGNTGYTTPNGPLPISGPRTMTARFGTTAFTTGVNSSSGNVANMAITTQNLNWGANQSSPNGLAERYDLKANNSGNPVVARYFALDMDTSWDTRNLMMKHILFTFAKPVSGLDIDVTIDSTVNTFTLMDGNANVAAFSAVNVVLGADTIKFSNAFIGKRYEFFRSGTKFIAVGSDGSRTEGNV